MEIIYSSTGQLAAAIRERRASAREVLDVHLNQIHEHNAAINAVITLDADRARERAREADAALDRGTVWGPLHGVPFTLKDAFATAGVRTTVGFPPLAEYVPDEDSTVAARLKQAGGILVGKTNVAELLADFQSSNPLFGRTSNPWNPARTSGGSSGGAAAAVAAGMTPFDVGTDLSASIRLPSAYCGVFGLKPTERRVALTGVVPDPRGTPRSVRIMASVGPIARSVEDLALLYSIIAGPDGRDTEVQPVPVEPLTPAELKQVRVAFAPTFPGLPAAASIREAITALGRQLVPICSVVEEATFSEVNFPEALASVGPLIGMILGAFDERSKERVATLPQYLEALQRRDERILEWERFFQQWDVLICPASMVTAFPHCKPGSPLQVDDRSEDYWMVSAHGAVFNYTGHPAVSVPYALDRDGLPIGVQLVGKRWGESRLLGIAQSLMAQTGGFRRPPGY